MVNDVNFENGIKEISVLTIEKKINDVIWEYGNVTIPFNNKSESFSFIQL